MLLSLSLSSFSIESINQMKYDSIIFQTEQRGAQKENLRGRERVKAETLGGKEMPIETLHQVTFDKLLKLCMYVYVYVCVCVPFNLHLTLVSSF